jgi:ribosomal RNA-processing protein 7
MHYLFIRPHSSKASKAKSGVLDGPELLPHDRTLFVVNIPPDATEREMTVLFSKAAPVERVSFSGQDHAEEFGDDVEDEDSTTEDENNTLAVDDAVMDVDQDDEEEGERRSTKKSKKSLEAKKRAPKVIPLPTANIRQLRKTGSFGHVVFTSPKGLESVLSLPASSLPLPWPKFKENSAAEPSGLNHYIAQYKAHRPPLQSIKEHADSSMEVFEYQQEQAKKNQSKYRKGEAIVDDDGFTLVTRGGAYGQTLGGGVGVASKKFMDNVASGTDNMKRKKKKDSKKEGFYAFQVRERRIKGMHSTPVLTSSSSMIS